MPLEIKIVPITKWTGKKNASPKRSQFRATYKDTIAKIRYELEKAGIVGDAQLQMFYRPEDMRLDGNLRSNAKPYEQGVKLVFERTGDRYQDPADGNWKSRIKPVSYPCDTYDDWQDNLRAIALSMEAFRQVERYGVFKYSDIMDRLALPSAGNKQDAAEFISGHSSFTAEEIISFKEHAQTAYRQAAAVLHPDRGGNVDQWHGLQEAKKALAI